MYRQLHRYRLRYIDVDSLNSLKLCIKQCCQTAYPILAQRRSVSEFLRAVAVF